MAKIGAVLPPEMVEKKTFKMCGLIMTNAKQRFSAVQAQQTRLLPFFLLAGLALFSFWTGMNFFIQPIGCGNIQA